MGKRNSEKTGISTWCKTYSMINIDGGRTTHKVPCGSCSACCRHYSEIEVLPTDWDGLKTVLSKNGDKVLDRNTDGSCVYLNDGRCSIHDKRPLVCRVYDCRVTAVAGIAPIKDGEISETAIIGAMKMEETLAFKRLEDKVAYMAVRIAAQSLMRDYPDMDAETIAGNSVLMMRKYLDVAGKMINSIEAIRKTDKHGLDRLLRDVEFGIKKFIAAGVAININYDKYKNHG